MQKKEKKAEEHGKKKKNEKSKMTVGKSNRAILRHSLQMNILAFQHIQRAY